MKVGFCIPALTGEIKTPCHQSLVNTYRILNQLGIQYDEFIIEDCPYLPVARAALVAMCMADPRITDVFFVDWDVRFDPVAVVKMLKRPEAIVGGTYPLKRDRLGFTAEIRTVDGVPVGRDGLIEAMFLPGGFLRIKRGVFPRLAEAYPDLKYETSVVAVMGEGITEAYDFFGMGSFSRKYRTEDYAFCQRWRDIGGTLWLYPDIEFAHVGKKAYPGNFHRYLMRLPGGAYDGLKIDRALAIEGWMTLPEVEWLAFQASRHTRIVELGCYLGRSTRALADNTPGVVYAIDNWEGPPEMKPDAEAEFRANLADHIETGRVVVWKTHHANLTYGFEPLSPDMIFVDGAHDFESVQRDIRNALKRLKPGGLLCGHDAYWEGVSRAVSQALPSAEVVSGTTLWHWTAPAEKETSDERVPQETVAS